MPFPPSSRSRCLAATLLVLVVGASAVLTGQESTPAPAGKGGKKEAAGGQQNTGTDPAKDGAAATPPPTNQGLIPFGKMLPIGEKHLILEIPSFKDGAPSSTVKAASMTRMDDENMLLERMDIRLFGPPAQSDRDMRVQLRTAIYHMPTHVLASDERSRISRMDFDLQGDSLVFDTATGQGKMVGNVKMVIFDASSFTAGAAPAAKPAEEGKPAPAPTPAVPVAPASQVSQPTPEKK